VRGAPFAPVGLHDATFLQPVAIGDMVRFEARVTHTGADGLFSVLVTMDLVEPSDHDRAPRRSNRLCFVFAGDKPRPVLPYSYPEILMHVTADRRHETQGVAPQAAVDIAAFFQHRNLKGSIRDDI
jgi:acyl-CoA hydrolase